MKKYLYTIILGLIASTNAMANVVYCDQGKCSTLDAEQNYPQIYTTMYGIFKSGIAKNMAICDSDSQFMSCKHNGIQYFGKVGVSDTNLSINALNIVDANINEENRNLEIINDYYTYVNGRRVVCTASKDVLSLANGNVALLANNVSCPYNMQTNSKNVHNFTIRLIDMDRKLLGVQYRVMDSVAAKSDAQGYAILSFQEVPDFDYAEISKIIKDTFPKPEPQTVTVAKQPQTVPVNPCLVNTQQQMGNGYNYGLTTPPVGMTQHVPCNTVQMQNNMVMGQQQNMNVPQQQQQYYSVEQQYQRQVQANMNGHAQQQQAPAQFSYKSQLPYPWGYYYAQDNVPKPKPEPTKKAVKPELKLEEMQTKVSTFGREYTVGPVPRNTIELDIHGNKTVIDATVPSPKTTIVTPTETSTITTTVTTTPVTVDTTPVYMPSGSVIETVAPPIPAPVVTYPPSLVDTTITTTTTTKTVTVEDGSIGVFDEELFETNTTK